MSDAATRYPFAFVMIAPTKRLTVEVSLEGLHLAVEDSGLVQVAGQKIWTQKPGTAAPPITNVTELVSAMMGGKGSHGYLQALLDGWANVVELRKTANTTAAGAGGAS